MRDDFALEDDDEQFDWIFRDNRDEVDRVVRRLVSFEITKERIQ